MLFWLVEWQPRRPFRGFFFVALQNILFKKNMNNRGNAPFFY